MAIRTVLFALSLTALSGGAALAECTAITEVNAAYSAGDEAAARAATSPGKLGQCDTDTAEVIKRTAAIVSFNRIATEVGAGKPLADFADELEALKAQYGPAWQLMDALGDIYRARKDYTAAADAYQQALEEGANTYVTPDWMAPTPDYIVRLDKLAGEMRLASAEPVRLVHRGPCKINFRGVALKKKATPIRYEFGKTEFTPDGLKAADDLYKCLVSVGAESITLTGHTDPVGSDEANLQLSIARADALAKFLTDQGYKGQYEAVGKGESEPFQPDDPKAYDEATLNQLHRRVDVDIVKTKAY